MHKKKSTKSHKSSKKKSKKNNKKASRNKSIKTGGGCDKILEPGIKISGLGNIDGFEIPDSEASLSKSIRYKSNSSIKHPMVN